MFVTLSHAIAEMTTTYPRSCSLILGNQLIHVGFMREADDLFLIALPGIQNEIKFII